MESTAREGKWLLQVSFVDKMSNHLDGSPPIADVAEDFIRCLSVDAITRLEERIDEWGLLVRWSSVSLQKHAGRQVCQGPPFVFCTEKSVHFPTANTNNNCSLLGLYT